MTDPIAKAPTTAVTLHLTPRQLARLDAWVAQRNARLVGRPVTRETEARRIVLDELGLADRMERTFWANVRSASAKVDPD
jgi:hypothetical protein